MSGRAGGTKALSVSRWACATLLCGGKAVVSPRAPAAISLRLGGRLLAPGNRGWPPLSDSADATRVLYCSPSQANAVAEVRHAGSLTSPTPGQSP